LESPTGRVVLKQDGPYYETLSENKLCQIWRNKKEITWQSKKINILSNEDLFVHFFANLNRDSMGQINIVRCLRAAKDFFELSRAWPETARLGIVTRGNPVFQNEMKELFSLSQYLFKEKSEGKERSLPAPRLFYQTLVPWIPKKRHALEVWLALFLSRHAPFIFKIGCFAHIGWKKIINKGIQ